MDEIQGTAQTASSETIDAIRLREFDALLLKYKSGKASLDQRVVAAENWWKLRNRAEEERSPDIGQGRGFRAQSGWLHNVITSKHADAMDNYPEPVVLPREPGDQETARMLSAVVPCIMEQQHFRRIYSAVMWQKLKTGTGCYSVGWDGEARDGLGEVCIRRVNLLHIFWAPGVEDIQSSPYLFRCEYAEPDEMEARYPGFGDRYHGNRMTLSKFRLDDAVDYSDKVLVVDVYYKRRVNDHTVLHYCKYAGDVVLYATEGGEMQERGLYDHAQYPFVFDPLWPVEGSPCGYGYVDLCKNPQTVADLMEGAFVKNALAGSTPRYMMRTDGAIKAEELLDLTNPLVHVASGTLDDMSIRPIESTPLGAGHLSVYDRVIEELRQTSGNTEAGTGSAPSGVTAASALAALQEASGKLSRDMMQCSYEAYERIVRLVIELVRQFYTLPRIFRITGDMGQTEFAAFSNVGMVPHEVSYGGTTLGVMEPEFDVKIRAQRSSAYSRAAQNDLALQLYGAGFFDPQRADMALVALDMMDFEGKDALMQKLSKNQLLYDRMMQAQQLALALLQKYEPQSAPQMAAAMGMAAPVQAAPAPVMSAGGAAGRESAITANARRRTAGTTEARGT